jgi:hypothetical protein
VDTILESTGLSHISNITSQVNVIFYARACLKKEIAYVKLALNEDSICVVFARCPVCIHVESVIKLIISNEIYTVLQLLRTALLDIA